VPGIKTGYYIKANGMLYAKKEQQTAERLQRKRESSEFMQW